MEGLDTCDDFLVATLDDRCLPRLGYMKRMIRFLSSTSEREIGSWMCKQRAGILQALDQAIGQTIKKVIDAQDGRIGTMVDNAVDNGDRSASRSREDDGRLGRLLAMMDRWFVNPALDSGMVAYAAMLALVGFVTGTSMSAFPVVVIWIAGLVR